MTGAGNSSRGTIARSTALALATNLPWALTGALAVQIARDLDVPATSVGALIGVFFAAAMVSSIAGGRLVERFGARAGMWTAGLLSMLSLLAGAVAWSPFMLAVALALGGIGTAVATPAAHLLMALKVPETRQGLAFGVLRTANPAAGFLAGAAVPAIGMTVGWRFAFLLGGLVTALAMVPLRKVARNVRIRAHHERPNLGPRAPLLLLAASVALGAGSVNALSAFFVASSVSAGIHEGRAGLILAIGGALGIAGRLIAGWLADRSTWDYLTGVAILLAGGAAGCALLAVGGGVAFYAGAFLAFGLGWSWPGLFQVAVVSRYRLAPAAATGYTQTGGFIGSAAGPAAFAALAVSVSYPAAWLATAIAAVGAIALAFAGARIFPDRRGVALAAAPALAATKGGSYEEDH